MDFEDLNRTLLERAIELANRYDFDKCEQITRILLSLTAIEKKEEKFSEEQTKPTIIDEREALENLELANDAFRGQAWMTIGDICEAFAQPKHEVRKWVENGEVVWQPREGDSRGTRMINAISVAARIDRGHCPPN